jgi:flavin reductase (DIM6/NTAB) family NADH-FMN oxidoreductase RutF
MDPAAKKTVLRHITYGMYAVTAAHDGKRGVFTANWLSQVSFEPPLIVVSVEVDSATLPIIRASGTFAICPFAADQRQLAADLGRPKARAGDKYDAFNLATETVRGVPVLKDTLGYIVCEVRNEIPAGDSVVILGEVVDVGVLNEGEPLTMRAAGFRHAG